MKNKPLQIRMTYALNGVLLAFRSERSLRFQVVAAIIVICLLGILQPALIWWAIMLITIGLVIFAEMVNTAIEAICDYVQPNHSEHIKFIKDVSAGAVLITSLCAVLVGVLFVMDLFSMW